MIIRRCLILADFQLPILKIFLRTREDSTKSDVYKTNVNSVNSVNCVLQIIYVTNISAKSIKQLLHKVYIFPRESLYIFEKHYILKYFFTILLVMGSKTKVLGSNLISMLCSQFWWKSLPLNICNRHQLWGKFRNT